MSSTKTHVRLANGQRFASTKACDISLNVTQHDFVRTFYVLRDLRAADIRLGLQWLDDEQATLKFDTERLFTLVDGIVIENQDIERRPECLLLS
jgi:hypothetical protein